MHYRPARETCRTVGPDSMLLVDSGAQFDCGTTDVTRTVHLGKPSQHQRDCFTRVLKGHIAIARYIFPSGTAGFLIDALARRDLWEAGLDYRHGTGHGAACEVAHRVGHGAPRRVILCADYALGINRYFGGGPER